MQALQAAGELFVIDMTFFARFPVAWVAQGSKTGADAPFGKNLK